MATTARSGLPEVWPSNITGLLVGEKSCVFAAWLPAHFRIEKRPNTFDFVTWRVAHTELVSKIVKTYERAGWTCRVEDQNRFRLIGQTCVLVGKPDIIAKKGDRVMVIDAKTGARKDEHGLQVAIYMIAIPLAWGSPTLLIDGEVCYSEPPSVFVELEFVEPIRDKLFRLLREIGQGPRPEPVPSERECKYCPVTEADCAARWQGEPWAGVIVSEF